MLSLNLLNLTKALVYEQIVSLKITKLLSCVCILLFIVLSVISNYISSSYRLGIALINAKKALYSARFILRIHSYADILARVAVGLVVLILSLTLIQDIEICHLKINKLTFIDLSSTRCISYLREIGLFAVLNFIIISIAMVVMSRGKGFIYDVFSQLINLTIAAIYLLIIAVDNGTKVEIGNSILDFQVMGLYQVSGFLVLCMGILCMISNRG